MCFYYIYLEVKKVNQYQTYLPVIKALGDPTRLKILDMLSCGSLCACEILENVHITQSTLSYHMKMLTESGLVEAVKDGSWMRYSVNTSMTDKFIGYINGIVTESEDCICHIPTKSKELSK